MSSYDKNYLIQSQVIEIADKKEDEKCLN